MYLSNIRTLIKENVSNLELISWKQYENVIVQYTDASEEQVIVQGVDKENVLIIGYTFVGTSETTGESFFDRDPDFHIQMRHPY